MIFELSERMVVGATPPLGGWALHLPEAPNAEPE